MPEWDRLAGEAVRASLPSSFDELISLALTSVRMAAVALEADPVDVLAALLVGRTAVEVEPAEQARREAGGER
jgi:hypothetical protein